MHHENSPEKKCPRCGATLPADAPEGLCPHCLAALPFATETRVADGSPASLPPAPTPEELAPHFPQLEILGCLGRGGMGVVYKARQKSLNRLVALKLLAPERTHDAGFAERFAREARALAALNHPGIVAVYDHGEAGGFHYLIMEFVDGVNLRRAMATDRFTPEQALAIVPAVCDALQYAHDHGVVHRDIKPENLLLDREGRVKVADFGIAKMLDASGADTGLDETAAGTPQYMAPEQRARATTDHRADIYSLGVVLYELLTGELPGAKLRPPSAKVQIDVRLDAIVLRALEASPELRYATATEFRTQVEGVAADTAGPATSAFFQKKNAVPSSSVKSSANRIKIILILGVVFLLLIAVPVALAAVFWFNRFRTERAAMANEMVNAAPKLTAIAWGDGDGIFSDATGNRIAWRPDGSSATAADMAGSGLLCVKRGIGSHEKNELHFWFQHTAIDPKSWVNVRLTDTSGHPLKEADSIMMTGVGVVQYASRPQNIPKRLSVRFAYAYGPWLDGRSFVPGKSWDTSLGGRVKVVTGESTDIVKNGKGWTFVDHAAPDTKGLCAKIAIERGDEAAPDNDYSFDAETADGRRLSPMPATSRPDGRTIQVFYFDVPPSQVARFLLRTRPVRVVDFPNVPLLPIPLSKEIKPDPSAATSYPKPNASQMAWLTQVDAENYGASWEASAKVFRDAVTQSGWVESLNQYRRPMGKLISRDAGRVMQASGGAEAKPGALFTVQFKTKFTGGAAVETVTCSLESDGKWRVSGYYIKPDLERIVASSDSARECKIAGDWLALTDTGEYAKSWDEAAKIFRGAVTRPVWAADLEKLRRPLGKVVSRTLVDMNRTAMSKVATEGTLAVLRYRTVFSADTGVLVETVTLTQPAGGECRVSGYYIAPETPAK